MSFQLISDYRSICFYGFVSKKLIFVCWIVYLMIGFLKVTSFLRTSMKNTLSKYIYFGFLSAALTFTVNAKSESVNSNEYQCDTEDCTSDFKKLMRLGDHGSSEAAVLLAIAFANGDGVEENHEQAKRFMLKAAKWRDPAALREMSLWLRKGFIFEQDIARSNDLLDRAVSQNFPPALVDKAKLLFKENNPVSDKASFQLLLQAKESTYLPAYELLALFYEHGIGTNVDLFSAAMMYKTLAIRGVEGANENLTKLAAILDGQNVDTKLLYIDPNIEIIAAESFDSELKIKELISNLKESGLYNGSAISNIPGNSCTRNRCRFGWTRDDKGDVPLWMKFTSRRR